MKRQFLIVVIITFVAMPAYADWFQRIAPLACNGNDFIVRFGVSNNGDSLDKAELQPTTGTLETLWKASSILTDHCVLQNGRKVSVTTHIGQAFPYGMGGADPDARFTLKMDDAFLYYQRIFYNGYQMNGSYAFSAVSYHEETLTECNSAASPRCKPQPYRLSGQGLSDAEQASMKEDVLRTQVGKITSLPARKSARMV